MPSIGDAPMRPTIAFVSIAILAYSLVVAHEILVGGLLVGTLLLLYPVWRIVTAFERIATALEAGTDSSELG